MKTLRTLTPTQVRRLAIAQQHLTASRLPATPEGILRTVQDLGCLQLDPISAVARSHNLVLWSRVGKFDPAHLDRLLWKDRVLFEFWAHQASIVLTEEYPTYSSMMRKFGSSDSVWDKRIRDFLKENASLRQHILESLKSNGPMLSRQFEDLSKRDWHVTTYSWNSGRKVSPMLDFMWLRGEIMVVGRKGGQKLWGLTEQHLPAWTPRDVLDDHELVYRAAQRSLRALGAATSTQIKWHYIRRRYPDLPTVLKELEKDGLIEQVRVQNDGQPWPGTWYIHTADLPLLEHVISGDWTPRTTLLSPFDNLICDRDRTEQLFNFFFRIEIYTPKEKRQYGYYVLPILHGDSVIGRIDPLFERRHKRLNINAVYAEPGAPKQAGRAVAQAIQELGDYLGAKEIAYGPVVPKAWKKALTSTS